MAEKVEAIVRLGLDNSRMKDFYDLWVLSRRFAFEGAITAQAIQATFDRRGTALPTTAPVALTDTFASSDAKQTQWRAFVRRSLGASDLLSLAATIADLRTFLLPPLDALRASSTFPGRWPPGGPWSLEDV